MNKTFFYTLAALIAFAANSVLCRWALADQTIDAYSFTWIRIVSGAATLLALLYLIKPKLAESQSLSSYFSPMSTLSLLVYMFGFSYAYIALGAGLGALILFVSVQFTMISYHVIKGNRLSKLESAGIFSSVLGLIYLLLPNTSEQTTGLLPLISMALAGISWGVYTLKGKGSSQPLLSTTINFVLASPVALLLLPFFASVSLITTEGIVYAILSGSVASGIGYAIWYWVMGRINTVIASVSQLSVPVFAALGGVVFLSEPLTLHFTISAFIILIGIGIVILAPTLKKSHEK